MPDPRSPLPSATPDALPPTPAVPLAALLAREDLGLRQIAGPREPGTAVHGAHSSEMADPFPYLLGGELLLTAGAHIPQGPKPDAGPEPRDGAEAVTDTATATATEADAGSPHDDAAVAAAAAAAAYCDAYVSRIVAAGGAALGFGVAPVHDTVPPALVAACEARGLPLLEVPPRTTFSAVARAVWELTARARHAELRRVTEAQQSLAAAASRPDPVPAVLRQLARRTGGRAVLYGPEGTRVAEAGRLPYAPEGTPTTEARSRPAQPGSRTAEEGNRTADEGPRTVEDGHRTAQEDRRTAENVDARLAALAGIVADGGAATATDTTADGTHLAAYGLGAGRGHALAVATPRREPGDHTVASVAAVLLALLTAERHGGAEAARSSALVRLLLGAAPQEVAPLLGGKRWQVVHGRPDGPAPDRTAASALGAALGSPLADLGDGVVRVLVPGELEPAAVPGWTLGVGTAATPADWTAADLRAGRALARARATRVPLVRDGARPALADLVPPGEAEAHARTLLAPLDVSPALADTLRTWLSLHGSWDRTAVALDVHRNTVRQRVARCAALLGTDLDDPDVRMELWFALREA